jgi:adenylate kinase
MKLILLSPPGAGKGTHGAWLARVTGTRRVSSGDLIRAEIARGTDLGRRLADYLRHGHLVPDRLVLELLTPVLIAAVREPGGYFLDGFPRTVTQARRAAELGVDLRPATDAAVCLTAPEPVLVGRLLARSRIEGRADDTPQIIRHRLDVFRRRTAPLIDHYREHGVLLEVDAARPVDVIRNDLRRRTAERGGLPPVGAGAPPIVSPRHTDDEGVHA